MSGQRIIDGLEDALAGRVGRVTAVHVVGVRRDPDYDWIPPLPPMTPHSATKLGVQCGECGIKFEYGKAYGYACQNSRCPRR